MLKAVHNGLGAFKATSEEAGGLDPVIYIAQDAKVMLCANLWVDVGLVNGARGTIVAICYENGHSPPDLPVAVMVRFDCYSGPTLSDGSVPICPLRRTAGSAQAGLGCHHPQVSRNDTRQGSH